MDRSAGSALRWLRALVIAFVSVAGGAIGHVSADGLLPGWGAMAALLVVSTAASAPLLSRPASTLRIVSLLVAGQTLIHLALTAAAGHKGSPVVASPDPVARRVVPDLTDTGHRVGSLHDQLYPDEAVLTHLTVPTPVQHVIADLTAANGLMALAHLAAAAAVGLWLAMGERALWTVLALSSDRVDAFVRALMGDLATAAGSLGHIAASVRTSQPFEAHPSDQRAPELLQLARAVVRRGPPRLLAA